EVQAAADEETPLGEVLDVGAHGQPYVTVWVVVLTPAGEAYARERWGDLVRVLGRLRPVD
ncbi:MAG TPA: hypothetical protein VD926_15315, partial [Acidimicrobiales bacterium]|nr:hypothetical protein [Acidimicrobiales bacterium]